MQTDSLRKCFKLLHVNLQKGICRKKNVFLPFPKF